MTAFLLFGALVAVSFGATSREQRAAVSFHPWDKIAGAVALALLIGMLIPP